MNTITIDPVRFMVLSVAMFIISVSAGYASFMLATWRKKKRGPRYPWRVRLNHWIARSVLRRFMFCHLSYHRFSATGRHGVIAADSVGEARNIACNLLLSHGYVIWGPNHPSPLKLEDFPDPVLQATGMVAVIGIHENLTNVYVDEEDED